MQLLDWDPKDRKRQLEESAKKCEMYFANGVCKPSDADQVSSDIGKQMLQENVLKVDIFGLIETERQRNVTFSVPEQMKGPSTE